MPLTDLKVYNAKATGKIQKLSDKSTVFLYSTPHRRLNFASMIIEKLLALGTCPNVSLVLAKDKGEEVW